jgi:YVTN family beta-propeller protein
MSCPYRIVFNPVNDDIYVTLLGSTNNTYFVYVIDSSTNTVTETIPVGGVPQDGIAFNPVT